MAKKRKTRTVYRKAKKVFRRRKSSKNKPEKMILPAGIYGALREKVSTMLDPVTSKVPGGSVADELVMGLASYIVAKKTKGTLREIGRAGLVIEAARVGEAMIDGSAFSALGAANTSKKTIYPV